MGAERNGQEPLSCLFKQTIALWEGSSHLGFTSQSSPPVDLTVRRRPVVVLPPASMLCVPQERYPVVSYAVEPLLLQGDEKLRALVR